MEKKNERTQAISVLLVLVGLLLVWTLAPAGDLEPSGAPAPTMKTLDEIYNAVIEGSSGILERDGYWADVNVGALSSHDFFTVPTGKQFILLRVTIIGDNGHPGNWEIRLTDGSFSMRSRYMRYFPDNFTYSGFCYEDFPDRSVVINAGDTLSIVNNDSFVRRVRIAGYFFDI